jgi:glycolate oxidase
VAENSGGVHCLKYGLTTNNLLGCELVLMSGEIVRFGGKAMDADGYDLLGLVTGSEGLLGIVTEVTGAHPAQAADGAGACCWASRPSRPPAPPSADIIAAASSRPGWR